MTSRTADRNDSVLAHVWRATMPEALAFVGPATILFAAQVWLLWSSPDHTLWTAASRLRLPVFFLGVCVLAPAFLSDTASRLNPMRWFQRGTAGTATTTGEDPGALVVAQPFLVGLGTALIGFAAGLDLIVAFDPASRDAEPMWAALIAGLPLLLCLVLVLARVTNSTRRLYDWSMYESSAAATAQADADAARLRALQVQMNPHFLFNALNTVASLLGNDDTRGRRTVRNLTAILKHTLDRSTKPLTTVEDEVRFVRDYLDIERERFGSRLQVTYAVDPDTAGMAIPTMSLQPLVENAIKHAVTERIEGGHIRISATRVFMPPSVRLVVEDDGPGFGKNIVEGTGLNNLRARLATLYGQEATLLTETIDRGARVSLIVPPVPMPEPNARADR